MRSSGAWLLCVALAVSGCTDGADTGPGEATDAVPTSETPVAASPTPTPTPEPTPSPTATGPAFGTGTATVDGTAIAVSGDCDISREFGTQPVTELDDEVDVLLAVDNIAGDGQASAPFSLRVRLLGDGAVEGRTITSEGAPGGDEGTADATYEGDVTVAELRDREELEFLDAAVLHLEATQELRSGDGPSTRELVVDVTCPVSRPG